MNTPAPPSAAPDDAAARLDDTIVQALTDAIGDPLLPLPPSPALPASASLKRRVMQGVAAQPHRPPDPAGGHLTSPPDGAGWQPFLSGVDIKVLHATGDVMAYLLRLQPGAGIPAHRHPMDEECVVLEGQVQIGQHLVLDAGGFHLARAGSLHDTIRSVHGATIYLRGAAPEVAHLL